MNPTESSRRVHPLDNATAIASRLRWLASQISTESQLLDSRDSEQRLLVGLVFQLGYQARVAQHAIDLDLAHAWIDEATNQLTRAIIARTPEVAP